MSDTDETQPPSDHEEYSNDDDEDQPPGYPKQGVRKRRTNIPTWAIEGPKPMQFNELGQFVGTNACKLSRFIGHVARDHALLPLDVKDLGDMEASRLLISWNRVKDTIIWTPEQINNTDLMGKIEQVVLAKFNDRWKSGKIGIRNKYFTPHQGLPIRFKSPDPTIEASVWKRCVDHWESKEYSDLQEINKKNASVPRMHHTTGTQTFAQVEHNHEKNTGKKVDRMTKFEICYTRRDGSFINGQAKKVVEDIAAVLSTMPQDTQNLIEGRNRAFQCIVDKDGHGRVFGYGSGVRSIDVSPKRKKRKLVDRDIEATKRELRKHFEKEYKEKHLKAQAEMEERLSRMVEEQVRKKMEEERLKRNAQVQEHMMQYSPEPSWIAMMMDTGYTSQTQGTEHINHLSHPAYLKSRHHYSTPTPVYPSIQHQPRFNDLYEPSFTTPPQHEHVHQNGDEVDH